MRINYRCVLAILFAVAACPLLSVALEQVTVTFYEEGLTNNTVRRAESFITDGQGFYRVDIDIETAPVYNLATNYTSGLEYGGNLFDTFSEYNPTLFVRNTNYAGFTSHSHRDNQAVSTDGFGRNGTLVSENEVLYARHYYADNPGRAVSFCNEDGELSWGYPTWSAEHPDKDLCLVRLDRDIDPTVIPAKVFTAHEYAILPPSIPVVVMNRHNNVYLHYASPRYTNLSEWDNGLTHYGGDGDSSNGVYLMTGGSAYVIGVLRTPLGFEAVTQEDIDLMRELLP